MSYGWSEIDPEIGERVKSARERTGLRQRDVVADTAYSAAYLSRVESGDRKPSISFLRAIAPALNVSVAWLETGEDVVDVRLLREIAEELLERRVFGGQGYQQMILDVALERAIGAQLAENAVVGLA